VTLSIVRGEEQQELNCARIEVYEASIMQLWASGLFCWVQELLIADVSEEVSNAKAQRRESVTFLLLENSTA
jgi:hypothetical protein